jgi:hypothetical protein
LIIVLTDENDCSIVPGGQSYLVLQSQLGDVPFRMPLATSACARDPNDACCMSCAQWSVPAGCPDPALDSSCGQNGGFYMEAQDALNVRCFDQKRRFGYDSLAPLERYARGFGSTTIAGAGGHDLPNPLFSSNRPLGHVFVTVVAGVPPMLVARKASDEAPEYATVRELEESDAFARMLGDPARGITPDPHMVESIYPRTGLPDGDAAPNADPIHGHELWPTNARNDLQYACIFAMSEPTPCAAIPKDGCECGQYSLAMQKPVCQAPDGPPRSASTTQYRTQAYPGPRLLALARQLGDQGIITSACAGPRDDPTSAAYGYRPAVAAIIERLRTAFDSGLPTLEDLAGVQ